MAELDVLDVVEICAGAGGQALGLERAGFEHALAVELDAAACATLRANRPAWKVAEGDVADRDLWRPEDYRGVALLAGGVPCPPFTVAGRQLGATDERDLFAWAVELCGIIQPRALLLENVRGLSTSRFSAYRQHVLDRLRDLGYVPGWRLLHASDFGVPQLRPRFVLVAVRQADAPWFRWPSPFARPPATVGETLGDLMAARGWPGAAAWARRADRIAPTIVGGSKKHGGADLGPTRAKRAWAELGVDGIGVADCAPGPSDSGDAAAAADLRDGGQAAGLAGRLGLAVQRPQDRALPADRQRVPAAGGGGAGFGHPARARARGRARGGRGAGSDSPDDAHVHDPVFRVLRSRADFLTARQIAQLAAGLSAGARLSQTAVLGRLRHLGQDFELEVADSGSGDGPRLPAGRLQGLPRPARARPPRALRRPPDHDQLAKTAQPAGRAHGYST